MTSQCRQVTKNLEVSENATQNCSPIHLSKATEVPIIRYSFFVIKADCLSEMKLCKIQRNGICPTLVRT